MVMMIWLFFGSFLLLGIVFSFFDRAAQKIMNETAKNETLLLFYQC